MSKGDAAVARAAQVEADARAWLVRLRSETPPPRQSFEDWYVADPDHASAYDRLLATWEATAHLTRASAEDVRRQPARRRWTVAIIAIAAVFVAFIAVGLVVATEFGRGPADAFVLETKIGEIRTDQLPDGTRVTLDTDSRIEGSFSASRRQLRLVRGRARVAVAPDPGRPIELDAAATVVRDGRVVDLRRQEGQTTVGMIDGGGTVAIAGVPIALGSGQAIAIPDTAPSTAPTSLRDVDRRWPAGMLSFENASLAQVVAEANRYTQIHIVLSGSEVAALRFTGTFRAGDTMGLARMLAAAFRLSLQRADNRLILSAFPTPK